MRKHNNSRKIIFCINLSRTEADLLFHLFASECISINIFFSNLLTSVKLHIKYYLHSDKNVISCLGHTTFLFLPHNLEKPNMKKIKK